MSGIVSDKKPPLGVTELSLSFSGCRNLEIMHFLAHVDINYFLLSTRKELVPEIMSCIFKHLVYA
jgi:hypothetical protein